LMTFASGGGLFIPGLGRPSDDAGTRLVCAMFCDDYGLTTDPPRPVLCCTRRDRTCDFTFSFSLQLRMWIWGLFQDLRYHFLLYLTRVFAGIRSSHAQHVVASFLDQKSYSRSSHKYHQLFPSQLDFEGMRNSLPRSIALRRSRRSRRRADNVGGGMNGMTGQATWRLEASAFFSLMRGSLDFASLYSCDEPTTKDWRCRVLLGSCICLSRLLCFGPWSDSYCLLCLCRWWYTSGSDVVGPEG